MPKFLVLDEPTSALDVSVQAQVLALLRQIREKYNIGMILITHNIAVISYMADQVNVMYAGKIVENGLKKDVILNPIHPYTSRPYISRSRRSDKEKKNYSEGGYSKLQRSHLQAAHPSSGVLKPQHMRLEC